MHLDVVPPGEDKRTRDFDRPSRCLTAAKMGSRCLDTQSGLRRCGSVTSLPG